MASKKFLFPFLFLFLILKIQAQKNIEIKSFKEFPIPNTSIRAIQVVNDSTIWFAGSKGKFGRIINNKVQIDSILFTNKLLNFRSIVFSGNNIFILSIESPAILYKINPFSDKIGSPEIVYQETHENAFYDSMTFFDANNGIAMGDPTSTCLSVITTHDGGNTWQKISCNNIPEIIPEEAAFAASNTNIAVHNKSAWLVTGGKKARVFFSDNYGKNWNVTETPIVQGGKMTGIYAVAFSDKNNGIIMGGNWEDKQSLQATKATTENGGKTWELIANNQMPGYISCVQYVPNTNGKHLVAVSTQGIYYSKNKGKKWDKISDKGFYSIRFIHKNTAWLSGNNKIAKIQFSN